MKQGRNLFVAATAAEAKIHPDDIAVDRFAAAMKAKLAKKRAEGRGGWDDKDACTRGALSQLLCEHVGKGDPLDVGAFAMMLHQRGETIHPMAKPRARRQSSRIVACAIITQFNTIRIWWQVRPIVLPEMAFGERYVELVEAEEETQP